MFTIATPHTCAFRDQSGAPLSERNGAAFRPCIRATVAPSSAMLLQGQEAGTGSALFCIGTGENRGHSRPENIIVTAQDRHPEYQLALRPHLNRRGIAKL